MKITLKAERELAFDSPDHLVPWGTRHDSFINPRFNRKLWQLYPPTQVVKVLDLGCAGGEFVRTCINDGNFAVGLEGSDWSKKNRRAAWPLIDHALFTCDVSRRFQLYLDDQLLQFDIVTAWEFIEHINEEDLPAVAHNVQMHLAPGGLWILSVTNQEDTAGGVRRHQTVRPGIWWTQKLESLGFQRADEFKRHFAGHYVRGGKSDNDVNFRLILTNDRSKVPRIPAVPLFLKLYDIWVGSKPHWLLKRLVDG
jgi:hypothetical protein